MRYLFLFCVVVACAPQSVGRKRPLVEPKQENSPSGPEVLGRVNGEVITSDDLGETFKVELVDLQNELSQRRMHLNWVAFEELISTRLISEEAGRRGISAKVLMRQVEGAAKVSDEDVKELYEANKERIPVPFEEAKDTLRRQLERDATERERRKFSEELLAKANVEYLLPVPEFPRYEIKLQDQPALGDSNARVTIVEFSDFECPYCSQAREILDELKQAYGNQLKIVYRDFPLAQHANARPAAAAAHCAYEQGKFWPYHDQLFEHATTLGKDELRAYAKKVSVDLDKFESCLSSERPEAAILVDESAAQELGVEGTPAIFINGVKLIGLLPIPLMKSIIDRELERT